MSMCCHVHVYGHVHVHVSSRTCLPSHFISQFQSTPLPHASKFRSQFFLWNEMRVRESVYMREEMVGEMSCSFVPCRDRDEKNEEMDVGTFFRVLTERTCRSLCRV